MESSYLYRIRDRTYSLLVISGWCNFLLLFSMALLDLVQYYLEKIQEFISHRMLVNQIIIQSLSANLYVNQYEFGYYVHHFQLILEARHTTPFHHYHIR